MTRLCLIVACTLAGDELECAAKAHERRFEATKELEVVYRVYEMIDRGENGFDQELRNEVQFAGSELYGRQRTLHMSGTIADALAAERFDPLLNVILREPERVIQYSERTRTAVIARPVQPKVAQFTFEQFTRKLFLAPLTELGMLDQALVIRTKGERPVTVMGKDIWLPFAFRQEGWQVALVDAADIASPPLGWGTDCKRPLRAVRRLKSMVDQCWLDRDRDFVLLARRLSFGDDDEALFHYGDFAQYDGCWLPRFVQWRWGSAHYLEEVVRLKLGPVQKEALRIDFPPGTIIRDQRSGTTEILPGGTMLLAETSEVIAHMYPEMVRYQAASTNRLQWIAFAAGLGATLAVYALLRWFRKFWSTKP